MKLQNIKHALCYLLAFGFLVSACETDFANPNAPTDEQILNSREGLIALGVGIRQQYSTTGLRQIIETPAITTREAAITTTFQNMIELEDGGADLPNFNSNVAGLWSSLLRVNSMSTNLINSLGNVELLSDTRNGLQAFAHLFKAMSIGSLAQNYEQVVVEPSLDKDSDFVPRQQAFEEAIRLLEAALSILPDEIPGELAPVLDGIDLENTLNAYLARYNLFAGNYDAAIDAAENVDLSSVSYFNYDILNPNPIWGRVYQGNAPNFKPRDNFGLPEELTVDSTDGRYDFYLIPLDEVNQNGLPIEDLRGFFLTDTESIPVYLPSEMTLIIAEANLRKSSPDVDAALEAINQVRTETDDAAGVVANIGEYDGDTSVDALLDEVYRNRRAELFLTGMSLEDSRRFGRPQPPLQAMMYDTERNRNFYPYPDRERNNNPNTPADPNI